MLLRIELFLIGPSTTNTNNKKNIGPIIGQGFEEMTSLGLVKGPTLSIRLGSASNGKENGDPLVTSPCPPLVIYVQKIKALFKKGAENIRVAETVHEFIFHASTTEFN